LEINKLKKILVIKHGAFGDFIQALGAFSSIRSHYGNDAQIDLITISSLQKIGQQTGYFNNVFIDNRKKSAYFRLG
jgi:ADP-heptose:LPS heptosyltransferase